MNINKRQWVRVVLFAWLQEFQQAGRGTNMQYRRVRVMEEYLIVSGRDPFPDLSLHLAVLEALS